MTTTRRPPLSLAEWLAGKSFEDLHAIEHAGTLLFPDALHTRGPDGGERLVPVTVRVPSKTDRALARIDAIQHVREIARKTGADVRTVEQAQAAIGHEVFDDIDTYAIVARATREPEAPFGQFMLLPLLMESYTPATVFDIYDRITFYAQLLDPRLPELTDADFWDAVAAVGRRRNTSPLVVMSGGAQSSFVVRMAETLSAYRLQQPSSPSSATSTPDA